MVRVSGTLVDFVEDPSIVAQVQVRAREVRPHGDGVMLDHPVKVDYAPSTGTVTFDAAAGTAGVIMWHAVGRSHASGSLPLIVPDGATATLRECVEAALVADDATVRELERLALQFIDDVEAARKISADLPGTIQTELDDRLPGQVTDLIAQDSTVVSAIESAAGGLDLVLHPEHQADLQLKADRREVEQLERRAHQAESALANALNAIDVLTAGSTPSPLYPSVVGQGLFRSAPTAGPVEITAGSGLYTLAGVNLVPDPRDPTLYRVGD